MAMQTICTIVEKEWLNDHAVSMVLNCGAMASDAAIGQFINIKCSDGQLLRRPISICEIKDNTLRIVFEARGEGTAWLAARKAGELLDVMGPLGHGFQVKAEDRVLVIGGGIGVPPLLASAQAAKDATAIVGFRSKEYAMLLDDLNAACSRVDVCTDDGSLGNHCFVDAQLRKVLAEDKNYDAILACGPKMMLKSVAAIAEEAGITCQVSLEERMGCGIGACLVCACKIKTADGEHYLHVCKNGPVFNSKEVCWDE